MTDSELVRAILCKSQRARDYDNVLIIGVIQVRLQEKGLPLLTEAQREVLESMNFEAIRRYRQDLQNDKGLYPASPAIAAARQKKGKRVRQEIVHTDSEALQDLIAGAEITSTADPFPIAKPKYIPLPWDQS